ncbi:MAG: carbon starvation CstA family protein [Phycisphaerales bacterium]
MSVLATVAIAAACLIIAYLTYARWLARRIFNLNPDATTPACQSSDDADFVPTKKSILFGHHFTSIAGTGPIVGPAIAVMWGWLPAILWVVLGSIFIGMLHDLGSLVVSLRNKGRTIGDIAGDLLGPRARILFLSILIVGLWIVLAVFGLVIAAVLKQYPAAITPVVAQIPLALLIGLFLHRKGRSIVLPSLIALAVMLLTVWLGAAAESLHTLGGTGVPPVASSSSTSSIPPALLHPLLHALHWFNTTLAAQPIWLWTAALLLYAYAASVLPVWTLLQPRDYINALQLILSLALIVCGLIAAALLGGPPIPDAIQNTPALPARLPLEFVAPTIETHPTGAPPLLPMLFITIACGACSGFHCLVASGTTSKQVRCETHAKPVAAGSMLTEGFLAVLVIAACAAGLGLGQIIRFGETSKHNQSTRAFSLQSFRDGLLAQAELRATSMTMELMDSNGVKTHLYVVSESVRGADKTSTIGSDPITRVVILRDLDDPERILSSLDGASMRAVSWRADWHGAKCYWKMEPSWPFIPASNDIFNTDPIAAASYWSTGWKSVVEPLPTWIVFTNQDSTIALRGKEAFLNQYTSWQAAGSLSRTVGAFVQGAGNFLAALGIPIALATALMAVMVAAFAATTMDTACRLQRYVIQELAALFLPKRQPADCPQCGYDCASSVAPASDRCSSPPALERGETSGHRDKGTQAVNEQEDTGQRPVPPKSRCPECGADFDPTITNSHTLPIRRRAARWFNPFKWLATIHGATIFAVLSAFFLAMGPIPSATLASPTPSWSSQLLANLNLWFEQGGRGGLILWPLFGATNQLLAGLAFIVVIAWLRSKRRPFWFALPPMGIMLIMPAWAMSWQAFIGNTDNPSWWAQSNWLLVGVAIATLALEAWLIIEALIRWRSAPPA